MLDVLERQQKLTTNQWKIISAAILGDMLDFFDYGLIAFALAFIVGHPGLPICPADLSAGALALN